LSKKIIWPSCAFGLNVEVEVPLAAAGADAPAGAEAPVGAEVVLSDEFPPPQAVSINDVKPITARERVRMTGIFF
jgi:hypothetical protein